MFKDGMAITHTCFVYILESLGMGLNKLSTIETKLT